jgi:hypothetical protein
MKRTKKQITRTKIWSLGFKFWNFIIVFIWNLIFGFWSFHLQLYPKYSNVTYLQQSIKVVDPLSLRRPPKNTQSVQDVAGRGDQLAGRYRSEICFILFI